MRTWAGRQALALVALSVAGAGVIYLIWPGAVTDDTFAFLDWGRDWRHGYVPLLEHRTFHPLPVAVGAVVSLFGQAAPTMTVIAAMAALLLLAAACWRVLSLLGFRQPAPVLGAALALLSPLLTVLALAAYINLFFASMLMWALAFELEGRRRATWTLLVLGGLVRPEGWAYLVAYGLLEWWRAGRPLAPRRWLLIAGLAATPVVIWLGLEWIMFGQPLYSFHYTRAPNVANTHSGNADSFLRNIRFGVAQAGLVAAAVGVAGVAWLAPRGRALVTIGMAVVALISLIVLASSSFNVPGRHFSVLVALLCVLAAAGACTAGRALGRFYRGPGSVLAALAGAGLLLLFAAPPDARQVRSQYRHVSAVHDAGATLASTVRRARHLIDTQGARRHSVAMLGAVFNAELVWDLGVPFNAVTGQQEDHARLIVQPSYKTWASLAAEHLTDRQRIEKPPGWRRLTRTPWQIFGRGHHVPVRLGVK